MLDVRMLGGFQVFVSGNLVPETVWRQRRVAAVVKLLALEPTHRLHREQLSDTLWPDLEPDAAANNLRVALHHARQGLRAAGAATESVLMRDGDAILLADPDHLSVDVARFQSAVTTAWNSSDPVLAQAALDLYPGDLLPDDLYDEWVKSPRGALRTSYLTLLHRLAQLWQDRNQPDRAISAYQRLIQFDPLEEAAHRSLIGLLATIGQPQRALELADTLVVLLARELDAPPRPATLELIAAIREGHFEPSASPRAPEPVAGSDRIAGRFRPLPAPVDELIGREREVAEVGQLLHRSRLVTLTGPGGVGKTRLGLAVAHDVVRSTHGDAAFVDLSAIEEAVLVLPAIAAASGVHEEPGQSLRDALIERLQDGPILLVIDNLEHVAASAPLIGDLLALCPALRVLATSRVRLRLKGEQEYQVQPLAVPDVPRAGRVPRNALPSPAAPLSPAVALFLRRAQAARPDFHLDAANAAIVGEICRQLDGLPLAIELASARVRLLSLGDLLAQLERPLQVLTGGPRDAPDRQRTLRATIAWSYDLLSDAERRLFAWLSVFAGGFTLEAVEGVAGVRNASFSVLDLVAALVDQSLVRQSADGDGHSRFTLLRTIREFAREQLAFMGEEDAAAQRHAAYFLAFAERIAPELSGPEQRHWLDRLEQEHDNLRQAMKTLHTQLESDQELRLAAALWRFWWYRGFLTEGRQLLEQALVDDSGRPGIRAEALDGAGALAEAQGDLAAAAIHHQAALDIRRQLADTEGEARSLIDLGMIAGRLGQPHRARHLYAEALQIARAGNHLPQVASSLANIGFAALDAGDRGEAVTAFRESLELFRQLDDPRNLSYVLGALGTVAFLAGDYRAAETMQEEALAVLRRLGDRQGVADTLADLAHAVQRAGDVPRAEDLYQEALTLYDDLGDLAGTAFVLTHHGRMHRALGDTARAERQLHDAAALAWQAASQPLLTEAVEGLAEVATDRGEWDNAARLLGMADALRAQTGMPLPAVHQTALAACAAAACSALGDAGFAAARAAGRALAADQVVIAIETEARR